VKKEEKATTEKRVVPVCQVSYCTGRSEADNGIEQPPTALKARGKRGEAVRPMGEHERDVLRGDKETATCAFPNTV
jgi:hypothetical protein